MCGPVFAQKKKKKIFAMFMREKCGENAFLFCKKRLPSCKSTMCENNSFWSSYIGHRGNVEGHYR